MNFYKKAFISSVTDKIKNRNFISENIKFLSKACITGIVTGIQKYSRKTIYTVDDGTGVLDCVRWNNESVALKKVQELREELNFENVILSEEAKECCHSLLNKIDVNEDKIEYLHGDLVCCYGVLKIINGNMLLDIDHSYKKDDVNYETLWILDVLSTHKKMQQHVAPSKGNKLGL